MSWKSEKLTDICTVTTGKWDANHASVDGEFRFYTCASKFLLCDTKRYEGKNIILPGNGANVGDVYFYDGAFDAYQRTYVLSNIKLIPEYLFYHLQSNWEETNRFKQYGSATNFLKIGNFKDYVVSYPSLAIQQKIVAKLDAIFAEIDTATAAAEANAKNVEILFNNYLTLLLEKENCKVYKFGDICDFSQGIQVDVNLQVEAKTKENQRRFLRIVDYTTGKEEPRYVETNSQKGFVNEDDISLVRYGNPGFVCRGLSGVIANNLFKVIPNKSILGNDMLYWLLKSPIFQYKINTNKSGVALQAINFKTISEFNFTIPPIIEQNRICSSICFIKEKVDVFINSNCKKIFEFKALKNSILKQAFNGELVKE